MTYQIKIQDKDKKTKDWIERTVVETETFESAKNLLLSWKSTYNKEGVGEFEGMFIVKDNGSKVLYKI